MIHAIRLLFRTVLYAELAGRLPSSGSTCMYGYVAMGELTAVLAAADSRRQRA